MLASWLIIEKELIMKHKLKITFAKNSEMLRCPDVYNDLPDVAQSMGLSSTSVKLDGTMIEITTEGDITAFDQFSGMVWYMDDVEKVEKSVNSAPFQNVPCPG